ncbi:Glycoprotein-N-acetylgalactosamine 3-beta-galactosyltransferase 1 [Holothuria leucospilota]|uniref:N-acetylgalactosaminide beta-1,3-galactosyltransferase n=1 Tax=Holothuria leucospilota TaxID=206669 RepID=A0A9Q1BF97_HOLLE|nr:Glycoprotein-N-acetylgalactosamine 3-beta-galactosyltransferase 1 [Holothuria leucospilota]
MQSRKAFSSRLQNESSCFFISFVVEEDALSNWMSPRIRILCWILTSPDTLEDKAVHVKATWAKRCNTVLFISSENTDFPTIAVSVDHEERDYLWQKTKGAFHYIYKHYLDKADWFLKADDDTYVVVENLRKLLHLYDTEKPIFLGRKFKFPHKEEVIYMQGGAGYVLSRKAVELLVEKSFKSKFYARIMKWNPAEDVMISMLLYEEGVEEGYSRDGIHETFHAVAPEEAIVPTMDPYAAHNFYTVKQGPECCSDYTISFHHVTPDTMHWLEYMVYHLRPFGDGYHACPADIRTIVGLQELPPTGSVKAIEGRNITNGENKGDSQIKKSTEKSTIKRKRNPRRKRITHVNTGESPEQLSEEKPKSKKERAPRRRRKKRVKGKVDVEEEWEAEEEEEEEEEEGRR